MDNNPIDPNEIIWDDQPSGENEIIWDQPKTSSQDMEASKNQESPYGGWLDVGSSFGAGLAKGIAALPGVVGDIQQIARAAEPYIGIKTPEKPLVQFPTSAETTEALKPYVSALGYEPETTGGKFAETIGEFASTPIGETKEIGAATKALDRAGQAAKNIATGTVLPAVGSEAAGQITEGTPIEPVARIAGAVSPSAAVKSLKSVAPDFSNVERSLSAAERAGVDLPSFAVAEGRPVKAMAAGISSLPFGGAPIESATRRALEQTGEAASKLHQQLGSATPAMAGSAAERGINDWIKGKSASQLDAAFKDMDSAISPNTMAPLSNTDQYVKQLRIERDAAGLPADSGATKIVNEAISRPGGLTFEGARRLRTEIGNHLSNIYRLPGDVNYGELKQLYKELTKDLRSAAQNYGGQKAIAAFDRANRMTEIIRGQQSRLAKIIGIKEGTYSSEQILGNIERLAMAGTKGNVDRLMLARRAMPPHDWENVVSGVVGKLGRDVEGNFSADRFVSGFNKMSPQARDVMFGPPNSTVRQSIEDIATVSSRMKEYAKYANTSKTAHAMKAAELISGLWADPFTTMGVAAGNRVLAHVLSSPKTARAAAGLAKAYEKALIASDLPPLQNPAVKSAYSAYVKSIQSLGSENESPREERKAGGRVYPAKRLTLLEKAALKAHKELAEGSKPLMDMPDEHIAHGLNMAQKG